ncbi:MAG: signal peptidase II, partial [Candidatus Cloacimonetes bacterium]|nr:signal peptidase II [Candidatus Cloacimonadota bacterium]
NLIDRLIFGKVTDFIDSDFPDFIMYRWPTFNLADSSIVVAIIIFIIYIFFFEKRKKVREIAESAPNLAEE